MTRLLMARDGRKFFVDSVDRDWRKSVVKLDECEPASI